MELNHTSETQISAFNMLGSAILKLIFAVSLFVYLNTGLIVKDSFKNGQAESFIGNVHQVYGSVLYKRKHSNTWSSLAEGIDILNGDLVYIKANSGMEMNRLSTVEKQVFRGEAFIEFKVSEFDKDDDKTQLLAHQNLYALGSRIAKKSLQKSVYTENSFTRRPAKIKKSFDLVDIRQGVTKSLFSYIDLGLFNDALWSPKLSLKIPPGKTYAKADLYWFDSGKTKEKWSILISEDPLFEKLHQKYDDFAFGSARIELPEGKWFVKINSRNF
ncbi:MAG: hypothetical protein VX642_07885, partial [Bdellovibrionota bacterium]|nr:hypothetical protein [Bdellovibrionota bacterium]